MITGKWPSLWPKSGLVNSVNMLEHFADVYITADDGKNLLCFAFVWFGLVWLGSVQFSLFETRTKEITLASQKEHKTIHGSQHNSKQKSAIGFSFTSDWFRKWREFFSQSLSVVMQNQSKGKFPFETC